MKPKLILLACLIPVVGLFLVVGLVPHTVSLATGPPPTATPEIVRSTYSLLSDLTAHSGTQPVKTIQTRFEGPTLLSPVTAPIAVTDNGTGWQRIMFQDFEGSFPPSGWSVHDSSSSDGGEYLWGQRDCKVLSGSYGIWAGGGGLDGGLLGCGQSYADNLRTWLKYGPFDLSQVTDAELQFGLWTDIEGDGANWIDGVFWGASSDGNLFGGWTTGGQTGDWVPEYLNLTSVPIVGDITGQPAAYVRWQFESNQSNPTLYEGVFIDDVALWAYIPPPPTPPPIPPALPITRHTTLADFARGRSHDGSVIQVEQGDGGLALVSQAQAVGNWERLPSLPRELFYHQAVTAQGYLFVIGGNSPDGGYQRRVYSARIQNDGLLGQWTELIPLPQAVIGHGAVVANGHLYVLGGFNFNGIQRSVFSAPIYDDGTLGEWNTSLPALPESLWLHGAVSAQGYIYVLGGLKSTEPYIVSDAVHRAKVYANGTLGDWETLSGKLPMPLHLYAAVPACDRLYLIGGASAIYEWNAVYYAEIRADGSLSAWHPAGDHLPKPLIAHSATATCGGILVTGGWESQDPVFNTQKGVYWAPLGPDCSLGTWVELTPLPFRTEQHALAATDRFVYHLGGLNGASRHFASVLMAPLQLENSAVQQGIFNHQFRLGRNYIIDSVQWTQEGSDDTQISLRYRVANAGGAYGPWSEYTSTTPITVDALRAYLEYQLRFEGGTGSSDRRVSEVSLSITAPDSVYLPLVVKD